MLHDILQTNAPVNHRALVFEDLDAFTTTSSMKQLTDYLYSKRAVHDGDHSARYRPERLLQRRRARPSISRRQRGSECAELRNPRGGSIVMHGYTHQYDSTPNLLTAVSGSDYEFWYAVQNRPVDEDSVQWAEDRMTNGLLEFTANGYKIVGWAAPQYQVSPKAAAATAATFPTTFQRAVYYTATNPQLGTGAANQDFSAGQFFLYIINSDYYGQRIIPENLGSIQYNICSIDQFSCITYVAAARDQCTVRAGRARRLRVVLLPSVLARTRPPAACIAGFESRDRHHEPRLYLGGRHDGQVTRLAASARSAMTMRIARVLRMGYDDAREGLSGGKR
jgi:uncharacterized protein YdaL